MKNLRSHTCQIAYVFCWIAWDMCKVDVRSSLTFLQLHIVYKLIKTMVPSLSQISDTVVTSRYATMILGSDFLSDRRELVLLLEITDQMVLDTLQPVSKCHLLSTSSRRFVEAAYVIAYWWFSSFIKECINRLGSASS